jgi:hypothetical protein
MEAGRVLDGWVGWLAVGLDEQETEAACSPRHGSRLVILGN